jgi:hypothetical protein
MKVLPVVLLIALKLASLAADERINHEGRLLGPLPVVTAPLLFNTPEADAVVSAMQIMPVDSPWNEDISARPLLSNSAAMITQITNDLATDRRKLRPFFEMNYVFVPETQPKVSIDFFNYPDESDLDGGTGTHGLYPIPTNLPVETWPVETGSLTLDQWQADVNGDGGDRHSIMVKPGSGFIWETWMTQRVGAAWEASNGAKFNLASNTLRPDGWTSGDAAGLPMFPALVRYDECERGMVEHALRLVVKRTRAAYLYPATHQASAGNTTSANIPAMGQRLRLKASFAIPVAWTKEEKTVLLALKKYGAIVADNGGFFSVSVCPDNRFPDGCFDHLSTVAISSFEVIQTTTATTGPRSAGAPTANAGEDRAIPFGATTALAGTRTGTGTIAWKTLAGPGTVSFANAASLNTTASFSLPGHYVLALSVADGTHAVTYDAVAVDVLLSVSILRDGSDALVQFPSLTGRLYRVEFARSLTAVCQTLQDNIAGNGSVLPIRDPGALSQSQRFYRVRVLP